MSKAPWIKSTTGLGKKSYSGGNIYHTQAWRKDRAAHLAAYPLCKHCNDNGTVTLATVSDHIVPIEQGGDVWDWNNRQPLCITCHQRKSAYESHISRKRG